MFDYLKKVKFEMMIIEILFFLIVKEIVVKQLIYLDQYNKENMKNEQKLQIVMKLLILYQMNYETII
jgi:hypothetical protein